MNPSLFQSKSVCELGCGLGMVTVLLAKLGVAQCVVATDGDDDTLDLLQENILSSECVGQVAVEKLYWGTESHIKNIIHKYHPITANGFDILIAADVVYEQEQIEPLISTVSSMLSRKLLCLLMFILTLLS